MTSLCRGPDGRLITVSTEHYRDPSADSPQQDPTDRSRTRGRSPADQHQNNAAKGRVQCREEELSESNKALVKLMKHMVVCRPERQGADEGQVPAPGEEPPAEHSGRSSTVS